MTGGVRDESAWDFFVSYTRADQAWAEWISWLLEEDGYRVLVQAWDMVAGSNWISRMDQGVQHAARTVAVLSPDYLSSVYGTAEWQVAWADDPRGLQRKLITVRVRGDWPVGLLAGVVGIDLVGLSETETQRRLRDEIAAAVRGRAKPGSPPPFPLTLRAVPAQPRFPGVRVLQPSAVFWDAQQSSLPGCDAPLVGRDEELGRLRTALAPAADSPRNRVVVVAGPGGIGKTRLVVEAGRAYTTEGNPLIAHTACEIAAQQGTYSWQDTASVLRSLFKIRLSHLATDGHEHLAVAVALAVLTTAQNSDQIAALVGAVHGIPRDSHRLHEILMDLADAGIADGPPFTLCPDVLGPVIVADSLADGRRVNVNLTRTLRVLGRAACWGAGAGEDSDEPGLLGIGPPRPGVDDALAGVHATILASQLGVLAQAAHLTGRDADLRMLCRAVLQLLSGQTDTTCWLDVLVLANAIGPYHPPLLGELRDELVRRWPPKPGQNLWGDNPVEFYRRQVERIFEQAASLARRVGQVDQRRAVSWILECAWLAHPVISSVKLDSLRQRSRRSSRRTRARLTGRGTRCSRAAPRSSIGYRSGGRIASPNLPRPSARVSERYVVLAKLRM